MNTKLNLLAALVATNTGFLAHGATVFSDNFNSYTDGNLAGTAQNAVGQGTWAQNNTSPTTPIQVSNGKLLIGTSGQDVYAPLTSTIPNTDGTSFYIGATLNFSAAQAAGDYFLHFDHTPGDTSAFYARVFAKSSGAGFLLGYLETSGTGTTTYGTTELNFNTDYRVVIAYDFVAGALNDTAAIYVNPLDLAVRGNNTPYLTDTWTTTTAETPTGAGSINLRQGNGTSPPTLSLDNLIVATTFGEAAPITPIPEPSVVGLSLLGLCAALALGRRVR